ncbi:MAG TPA: Hint domain-containing protein, partial [Terriglobia bacterium]|nr:Hint domain-containing protein [Terriglobia bacterium]
MIFDLDTNSLESYRLFLRIKKLPRYRFQGHRAIVPDEYAALLGVQQPTLSHRPYRPLPGLFDYQRDIARIAIEKKKFCVFAEPGLGKCVAEGTLISTSRGLIPIENLKPSGDKEIYDINETVKSIDGPATASYFYDSGVKPTVSIATRMGYSLTGTLIHPVLTLSPDGQIEWKKMVDISEGDFVAIQRSH